MDFSGGSRVSFLQTQLFPVCQTLAAKGLKIKFERFKVLSLIKFVFDFVLFILKARFCSVRNLNVNRTLFLCEPVKRFSREKQIFRLLVLRTPLVNDFEIFDRFLSEN